MVSGRTAVEAGWARLPDDVRTGVLAGQDGRAPLKAAYLQIMRCLFPEISARTLASRTSAFEETVAQHVIERIKESEPWLRTVGQLLAQVESRLRQGQHHVAREKVFTRVITDDVEQTLTPEQIEARAAEISDSLAVSDDSKSPAALARLFADPGQREAYDQQLDSAWVRRIPTSPGKLSKEEEDVAAIYGGYLEGYLRSTSAPSKETAVAISDDGAAAWRAAAELDTPLRILKNPPLFGLSVLPSPSRPRLTYGEQRSDAGTDDVNPIHPLDQSIQRRLWSVLHGAARQSWRTELPDLDEMVSREVDASAQPLGLQTGYARAGLSAGALAYTAITPDERVEALLTCEGAIGYLNSHVHSMLARVGGFGKLDATAQNDLWDPGSRLVPELWKVLHNAEYRSATTTEPGWVWSRIAGGVQTLVLEIKDRHKSGGPRLTWRPTDPAEAADDDASTADLLARDARVKSVMAYVCDTRGEEGLLDILRFRATSAAPAESGVRVPKPWEVRVEWEASNAELTLQPGVEGASWRDLLSYLDDHLPRR